MGLCFLNGAKPGGLYRNIGRQRRYEASLCAVGAIMCAFYSRGLFANTQYRTTVHQEDHMGDDNDAIIKIKRAGHSLATIDRTERSGVRSESSGGITRDENACSRRNLFFTSRDRRIFGTAISSFVLFHIPEIRILFRGVPLYLARHSVCRTADLRQTVNVSLTAGFYRRSENNRNAESGFYYFATCALSLRICLLNFSCGNCQ